MGLMKKVSGIYVFYSFISVKYLWFMCWKISGENEENNVVAIGIAYRVNWVVIIFFFIPNNILLMIYYSNFIRIQVAWIMCTQIENIELLVKNNYMI